MARIRFLVEVYRKIEGEFARQYTYVSTPINATKDIITLDCDNTIESASDSFSFRVENTKLPSGLYAYQRNIKVDDRVLIYITANEDITDANKDSYQRYDGLVTATTYQVGSDGRVLSIKGLNRFEKVMNFTWPAIFESETATNIIQNLLEQVNDENRLNQVTWASGNSTTSTPIQYMRNYRPINEQIEELSSQAINKEYNAYYYINKDNEFVFKQKTKDTDSISLVEGVDFEEVKIQEKVWEVINAMIMDCGKGPSNRSIHAMYYNEDSATEFGLKWAPTIEVRTELAEKTMERARKADGWVNNSDENKQNFPDSSAYPLTLPFYGRDSLGNITDTQVVVSNDSEFTLAVRREARAEGVDILQTILDRTGNVRPKIDITLPGATWELGAGRTGTSAENCLDSNGAPIQQGDIITLTCPTYGGEFATGYNARVMHLSHEIDRQGWTVAIRLEVDIEDAKGYEASGRVQIPPEEGD